MNCLRDLGNVSDAFLRLHLLRVQRDRSHAIDAHELKTRGSRSRVQIGVAVRVIEEKRVSGLSAISKVPEVLMTSQRINWLLDNIEFKHMADDVEASMTF